MDDITILKNRLAYFSNRVSYKSDFEEIDFKIDYEPEPNYDDEIEDEDYKEYMSGELVNKVKQLIRNEDIDFYKTTYKELRNILNISKNEVKELIDQHYDEFVNEQEIVYKKQGKEYEEDEVEEEEDKEKIKLGKKMKKLLKDLKKK